MKGCEDTPPHHRADLDGPLAEGHLRRSAPTWALLLVPPFFFVPYVPQYQCPRADHVTRVLFLWRMTFISGFLVDGFLHVQ